MNTEKLLNTLSTDSIVEMLNVIITDTLYLRSGVREWSIDGYTVQISADGKSAVVGAHYEDFCTGCAYVFKRCSSGWEYADKLRYPKLMNFEDYGGSVAINRDGTIAAVTGTLTDLTGDTYTPVTCIFTKGEDGWEFKQRLEAGSVHKPPIHKPTVSIVKDGSVITMWTQEGVKTYRKNKETFNWC